MHATLRNTYMTVAVFFVAFLLLSNIGATKLIEFDLGFTTIVADGGAILFPFTYILGDVLAEVFGFKATRRVIYMGFIASIIASVTFFLVQIAPPAADYANQEAFEAVLGFVPRIVLASVCGYLVGQLVNAYVLVWIKKTYGEKHLWARLLGSTIVGEMVDTFIFCFVAWLGVVPVGTILNLMIVGFFYKVAVEAILLPVTYRVIAYVKRHADETDIERA